MRLFLTFTLLFTYAVCFGQIDTIFYSATYNVCTRKEAKTYIFPIIEDGDRYKFTERYISNDLYSEGFSLFRDSLILDGPYKSYYENGNTKEEGLFVNDQRIGTWRYYYEDGNKLWANTEYKSNSDTIALIRSYYKTGKLKRVEYRKLNPQHSVSNDKYISSGICYKEDGKKQKFTPFSTVPTFKKDINTYLSNNIKYPPDAQENNIEGRVLIMFAVEKNGKVNEVVSLNKRVHSLLEIEAQRLVRATSGLWNPGSLDDIPVRRYLTLPVLFRLE
jgi:TonB family protein